MTRAHPHSHRPGPSSPATHKPSRLPTCRTRPRPTRRGSEGTRPMSGAPSAPCSMAAQQTPGVAARCSARSKSAPPGGAAPSPGAPDHAPRTATVAARARRRTRRVVMTCRTFANSGMEFSPASAATESGRWRTVQGGELDDCDASVRSVLAEDVDPMAAASAPERADVHRLLLRGLTDARVLGPVGQQHR